MPEPRVFFIKELRVIEVKEKNKRPFYEIKNHLFTPRFFHNFNNRCCKESSALALENAIKLKQVPAHTSMPLKGFTHCVLWGLESKEGKRIDAPTYHGYSLLSDKDQYCRKVGREISLRRALKQVVLSFLTADPLVFPQCPKPFSQTPAQEPTPPYFHWPARHGETLCGLTIKAAEGRVSFDLAEFCNPRLYACPECMKLILSAKKEAKKYVH